MNALQHVTSMYKRVMVELVGAPRGNVIAGVTVCACHSLCPRTMCVHVSVPGCHRGRWEHAHPCACVSASHFVVHGSKGQGKTMWLSDLLLGRLGALGREGPQVSGLGGGEHHTVSRRTCARNAGDGHLCTRRISGHTLGHTLKGTGSQPLPGYTVLDTGTHSRRHSHTPARPQPCPLST